MLFRQIAESKLAQYSYLIGCQRTGEAILFDPERDVDRYIELAAREGLKITAVAETHIHADFLSGARELAHRIGARLYVSAEGGPDWQSKWIGPYDHVLLRDGNSFKVGGIEIRAMHTPGHTPEHMCYLVTDRGGGADVPMGLISGDFVFVGDLGRPDLLESAAGLQGIAEPSARALYASARKFCQLPESLQVWPAHGAGSACGKALGAIPQTTVGYEKATSPALRLVGNEAAFVDDILSGQPEPPIYFARMKELNRDGVPILDAMPRPEFVSDLSSRCGEWERSHTVIVDTRAWGEFRDGHIPGAIYAPPGKMFPMVVGSYVKPQEKIVLVCERAMADELVRDLVRIGYDHVIAVVDPSVVKSAPKLDTTPEVTVQHAAAQVGDAFILDVRGASEHASGCVDGSCNIAYTRLTTGLARIPRDAQVFVHCALGGRSAASVSMLRRLGYDAVNVSGGFEAWKAAKLPTTLPAAARATAGCCGGGCRSVVPGHR